MIGYPVGQEFHGNYSILHRFRHKYVFHYTEFQGVHQKWWENVLFKILFKSCFCDKYVFTVM